MLGGSGQYAKIKVEFSPKTTETNEVDFDKSDLEFISEIKGGSIPKEYIPGVQKG